MHEYISSQPEPASTANAASRGELDKLLLQIEHHAQTVMRKEGRLSPAFFAASSKDVPVYAPGHLNEVSKKNDFAAVAQLICVARGAVACVLALEKWVLQPKPGERFDPNALPSQSPLRKDYIGLSGEALGGICEQRLLPILRDQRARFSCLGTANVLLRDPAEGRFTNLQPSTPLTDAVRALAAYLLKLRGLVITTVSPEGPRGAAFQTWTA